MIIDCEVILKWSATPGQLTELGSALWQWCTGPDRSAGLTQYLDSQALADLVAGKLPASDPWYPQADRKACFWVRGEGPLGRQAAINALRRVLPVGGVEDVLVAGRSWDLAGETCP